jgi:hypothetical protein
MLLLAVTRRNKLAPPADTQYRTHALLQRLGGQSPTIRVSFLT